VIRPRQPAQRPHHVAVLEHAQHPCPEDGRARQRRQRDHRRAAPRRGGLFVGLDGAADVRVEVAQGGGDAPDGREVVGLAAVGRVHPRVAELRQRLGEAVLYHGLLGGVRVNCVRVIFG